MRNVSAIVVRLIITLALGLLVGVFISEGSFLLMKDPTSHDTPQRFDLVVPAGTADRLAAGQEGIALPASMVFVEGDVLVVHNEDSVSHQLGPIWVPPSSSGELTLGSANEYSYACSFQANKYLGLDVRPRVTPYIRFQGILSVGLPSAMIIGLYSLVLVPMKKKNQAAGAGS